MKNLFYLKVVSCLLSVGLLAIGFTLAHHRPLWNDEISSQVHSIEGISYREIFRGKITEGNNSPLFYSLQKIVCKLAGFRFPEWEGEYYVHDLTAKIILRFNPIVCITLSIVAIFYFFTRFYSWGAGLFSVFLSLSTTVLWWYWAEARPYALWILLTTMQALVFLCLLRDDKDKRKLFRWLQAIHLLLSLTIVFSVAQIVIVSALLWILKERDWKKYILLTALPCFLCIIYYILGPRSSYWLLFSLEQYIREGISRDRLYLMAVFVVYLLLYFSQKKTGYPKLYTDNVILEGVPYLFFTLGMILSVCILVGILKVNQGSHRNGFPVTTRYFVHLAPIGIIATTLFTENLMRAFKQNIWMRVIIVVGTGYLVIHRVFKVIPDIRGHYPGFFS